MRLKVIGGRSKTETHARNVLV